MAINLAEQTLWIFSVLAAGTLIGVFVKMKPGFGPMNLRIVGIVLIAFLACILAVFNTNTLNAAMGILGAIAGYLFGTKEKEKPSAGGSVADASGSSFGDNAKIAGRDINETVNNIHSQLQDLDKIVAQAGAKIDRIVTYQQDQQRSEYLLNSIYERSMPEVQRAVAQVIGAWESQGWSLVGLTSDYQGMDGIFLLFRRPSSSDQGGIRVFHSSRMSPVQ